MAAGRWRAHSAEWCRSLRESISTCCLSEPSELNSSDKRLRKAMRGSAPSAIKGFSVIWNFIQEIAARTAFNPTQQTNRSFHTVSEDGAVFFYHVDRNGRPQSSALHDFAPDENVTAKRADLQGIVDRAAARAGHHRVRGAVTILLRELAQVRYEFQVAVPIGFEKGKGPKASAGETNHHRIHLFVSQRLHKSKLFRRPRLGKFFGSRRDCRTIGVWSLRTWRRGWRHGQCCRCFRRWGCGRTTRGAFHSPQKNAPDQEYKGRQSTNLQEAFGIEIGRTRRSARARIAHAGDVWHFHAKPVIFFRRWTCRLVCGFDWHGHQYLRIWISAPLRSYRTSSISVLIR